MKPKTMILMAVAIVCGLGASYMTSRLLAERDEQAPPPARAAPPERATFLVAKTNLDLGAAIKKPQEMFVEKSVLKDDAPKDGITDLKVLKGKFLKRGLRKDDRICLEDLMDEKTSLLANLPDGYRAIGVQVTNDGTASGFASLPGSKVDVVWTMKRTEDKCSFSKILVVDVLVLAADTKSTRDEGDKAMPAGIVTLALKQSDALKIDLAKRFGPLTLFLRKYGDLTPPPEKEMFTGDNLFKSKLDRKGQKKSDTGSAGISEDPEPDPLQNVPALPTTEKKEEKENEKETAPPPAPKVKRYYHVVNFRQGDKQWRQVIEVDAKGNPIHDDIEREAQDQAAQQQQAPTVQAQPAPQQQGQPPANGKKAPDEANQKPAPK